MAFAQGGQNPQPQPKVPESGKMHLWCKVGSFRLEGKGRVELDFTGTLLISGHSGPAPVVTGKVRKEYQGMGRTVYFGTGRAVIEGEWRRIQWFGNNMDCRWTGKGMALVFGEYDKEKQTGRIQVDDLPELEWLTTGRAFYVPKQLDPYWQNYEDLKKRSVGK